MNSSIKQIITFVLLTFCLTAIPYALLIYNGRMELGFTVVALMWCPGLAAIITCRIYNIQLSSLGWRFYPLRYEWIAYILPILYTLPVYVVVWLAISGSFNYSAFIETQSKIYGLPFAPNFATWAVAVPLMLTVGVIRALALTLGEELGWRGFLFPRLMTRVGFSLACLITGLIWASWHYVGIIYAGYSSGIPKTQAILFFTIMAIALSFILGYIRLKTESIWPCALLHASHNIFIQGVCDPLTVPGAASFWVGEFGAGLAITTSLIALIITLRLHPNKQHN